MKTAFVSFALLLVACGGAVTDPSSSPSSTPSASGDGSPGACASETLASDVVDYGRLAASGSTVFWNTNDGRLVRHDATGSTAIASVSLTSMAVDDANVYGTTLDSVIAVPRAGGEPVTLVGERALSLVLRDDTLFYVAEDAQAIVAYGPLHGQAARTVVAQSAFQPYYLAVDDENVYFESDSSGPPPGNVWQASRSGGPAQMSVLLATKNELASLAASGGTLYYANGTDLVTSGVLAVTGPGTPRVVVPLANVDALELLVDGTVGYFAVADAVPKPAYHSRVYRFALDGSGSTLLADVGADTLVANLVTTDDAIYFTTLSGVEEGIGTVRKMCK